MKWNLIVPATDIIPPTRIIQFDAMKLKQFIVGEQM